MEASISTAPGAVIEAERGLSSFSGGGVGAAERTGEAKEEKRRRLRLKKNDRKVRIVKPP